VVLVQVLYMLIAFAVELTSSSRESHGSLLLYDRQGTLVYFGTAMYAFEGVSMLMPIERCLKHPEAMSRVVVFTMGGSCILQIVFAGAAYLLYLDDTASIITISLTTGSLIGGTTAVQIVQIAWVVEVLFTFPLQLFPVALIVEGLCFPDRHSGHKWTKNLIRIGLASLCVGVALGGYSSVDNLVSLIGAIGCVPLAIVFPALFHLKTVKSFQAQEDDSSEAPAPLLWTADAEIKPHTRPELGGKEALYGPQLQGCAHDWAIVIFGSLGLLLSVWLAVQAWITADFQYQQCVMRG